MNRLLLYTEVEHNSTLTPEEKEACCLLICLMDLMGSKNSKEDSTKI
jgi:hypothetical protein